MDIFYLKQDNSFYPSILHKCLGMRSPVTIATIGNTEILQKRMLSLFCSVKCPGNLILKTYDMVQNLRETNITVISGFHSPMERECLAILLRGKQSIVYCPARSIEKMKIRTEYKDALNDGRLLIISPFKDKPLRPTAETSFYRNQFVSALAEKVFVAYAEPSSKTEQLCRDVLTWQKPLYTFDSSANANLIALGATLLSQDNISGWI